MISPFCAEPWLYEVLSVGWKLVSFLPSKPAANSICGTEHDPKLPMPELAAAVEEDAAADAAAVVVAAVVAAAELVAAVLWAGAATDAADPAMGAP